MYVQAIDIQLKVSMLIFIWKQKKSINIPTIFHDHNCYFLELGKEKSTSFNKIKVNEPTDRVDRKPKKEY